MKLEKDVVAVLKDGVENGIDDPGAFTYAVEAALTVLQPIVDFCKKHGNIALSCGSEWMYQSDSGQEGALETFGKILDSLEDYADQEDE